MRLNKAQKKRIIRRSVSLAAALAMLLDGTYTWSIIDSIPFFETNDNKSQITAFAAEVTGNDPDFPHDNEESKEIRIAVENFKEYSDNCQIYSTYHQNDKITIFSTGTSDLFESGFAGLGTQSKPFKGSVEIASNTDITLNLDAPLFNYVYDSVTLKNNSKPFVISRYYIKDTADETTPIVAKQVYHDEDNSNLVTWDIDLTTPSDSTEHYLSQFGGFIGTMDDEYGAPKLALNVTMNTATLTKEGNTKNDIGNIKINGSGDLGLACGHMDAGAELTFTYTANRAISAIDTSGGDVGGLIGEMESGAVFTYNVSNPLADGIDIKTDGGYAGGIVGKNDQGTVNINLPNGQSAYSVTQHMEGTSGAGGVYGYYKPTSALTGDNSFDTSKWVTKVTKEVVDPETNEVSNSDYICQVNGTGYTGGLFGVLDTEVDVTINGSGNVISNHASGSCTSYGGLIGQYKTNSVMHTLTIDTVTATPSKDGAATFYGGGIGQIESNNPAYVEFNSFTANASNAGNLTFGGLVASADNTYIKTTAAGITASGYKGGGLVGSLANGVLQISDANTINGASAAPANGEELRVGKIVGYRDNGLVFLDSGASCSSGLANVDDIGSWGGILNYPSVLAVNNEAHTVTVSSPTSSYTAISNTSDFIISALNFQFDETSFLKFNTSKVDISSSDITLSGDVNLSGTGVYGLTRDNDIGSTMDKCVYSGTFTGGGNTVTFDTGTIYRHKYNGLFAKLNGGTVQNVTFGGTITVNAQSDMYVGAAAAKATGNFTANNVTVNTAMPYSGSSNLYIGGILGEADSSIGSINVTSCTVNANISGGNGEAVIGGVIGQISHKSDATRTWTFTNDTTISGTISNSSSGELGGLVAVIKGDYNGNTNHRTLTLSDVTINGLNVSGNGSSMGGLLGYSWLKTDVNVTDVTVKSVSDNKSTVSNSDSGGIGGMVYRATGKWALTKLDIKNIVVSGSGSVGMIVNRGISHNDGKFYTEGSRSALYLYLPSGYIYNIDSSTLPTVSVFDELCAYTAPDADSVLRNGNGVISINTTFATDGSTASGSYHARTAEGASANPNSRYYYNLNTLGDSNSAKLMKWALNQYACTNLEQYFADPFSNNTISNQTYDMNGYSWYPVDLDKSITVNGTFKFYSHEFELSEDAKKTAETANAYDRTNLEKNQHYTMHCGLFRNVASGKTLTIGTTKFQGDVGLIDGGSGALICGTVQGASNTAKAKVEVSGSGSVSLDGIYVYGVTSDNYAPLLINKAGSYVDLTIRNVGTNLDSTNKYLKSNVDANTSSAPFITNKDDNNSYPKAASSLIGDVGLSDSPTGITVNFSNIKLDGRTTAVTDNTYNEQLTSVYGSDLTIFTKSTLLNQFKYASGSTGKYDYTYGEDWDNSSHAGKGVTYGKEVGYTSSDTNTEYPGKEQKYSGSEYFTSPITPLAGTAYNGFNNFLPYVCVSYNSTNKTHQLRVNHAASTATGCGTYYDPYILSDGSKLEAFCYWINTGFTGSSENGDKIFIPTANLSKTGSSITKIGQTTCIEKTAHSEFTYNGTNFTGTVNGTAYTINSDVMRTYLAGAYYQIPDGVNSISIPSSATTDHSFTGLGNTNDNSAVFRGVIDGNGMTIINNTGYPLIESSNGSVVKDLTIEAPQSNPITLNGTQKEFDSNSGDSTKNNAAYGAVMAKIFGGDNIIDNVSIALGTSSNKANITLTGDHAQLVPVGGYVGVVVNGGLYFRNMSRADNNGNEMLYDESLFDNVAFSAEANDATDTAPMSDSNTEWLYVNPIVGRVINGFAVTESDKYRPYEDGIRTYHGGTTDDILYWDEKNQAEFKTAPALLSHVTMQNGNKNYSIADIDSDMGKLNTSSSPIDVPNGQSLFIMSAIVNSGMSYKSLGYSNNAVGSNNYFVSRSNADYNYIGKIPTSNQDPAYTAATADYSSAAKDGTAIRGYLMTAYTTGDTDISGANNKNVTLSTANGKYYLPDGFKGIGNMYQSSDNYRMKITGFNGNGATVSMNSSWYYYMNDTDGAGSVKLFDTVYHHHSHVGFGLFNYQNGTTNSASNRYYNFILTGNVVTDCIDSNSPTGDHIFYKGDRTDAGYDRPHKESNDNPEGILVSVDGDYMVSTGGLIGVTNASQWLDRVALQNMYVHGIRYSGGLIGLNIGVANTSFTYKNTEINNKTLDSSEIKVRGASTCGGMIGKNQFAQIDIDNGNASYSITEVVSECENMAGSDFNYGVGGFIGACRTGPDKGETKNTIIIKNIIVGTDNQPTPSEVKADNADIFTGGMIGILNKGTLTITNCTINNQSVSTQYIAGGLCGYYATATGEGNISDVTIYAKDYQSSTITNPHITSTNKAAGGFFGSLKDEFNVNGNTNPGNTLNISNSQINGYNISASSTSDSYAGGAIGLFGHYVDGTNTNNILNLHDIAIQNCIISAKNAGGLVGGMAERAGKYKHLYGYNILTQDLTITGDVIGGVCGKMLNNTECVIKLAGFSRQGNISTSNLVGYPRKGVTKERTKTIFYKKDGVSESITKEYETDFSPWEDNTLDVSVGNGTVSYSGQKIAFNTGDTIEKKSQMPDNDLNTLLNNNEVKNIGDLTDSSRSVNGFYLRTYRSDGTHYVSDTLKNNYTLEELSSFYNNNTSHPSKWFFEKSGNYYKIKTSSNQYIKLDTAHSSGIDFTNSENATLFTILDYAQNTNGTGFRFRTSEKISNNNYYYIQTRGGGPEVKFEPNSNANQDKNNYYFKIFYTKTLPDLCASNYSNVNITENDVSTSIDLGEGTSPIVADNALQSYYTEYNCNSENGDELYIIIKTEKQNEDSENFGDNSYIIFADYNGTQSNEASQNMYTASGTVADASPFVTLNPKFTITENGTAVKYLTGDGVSSQFYDQSVFKAITDDRADSENHPKAYKLYELTTGEGETVDDAIKAIKAEYSNSATEFRTYSGYDTSGIMNFPLLVAENTNKEELTALINNYLRVLTNTNYNFADTTNSAIFDVDLYKCVFNGTTKVFDVDTSSSETACLKKEPLIANNTTSYYFKMEASNVDTQDIPQFSLLDVKFKDPNNRSNIAYHLYVPVYVKKVIRYDFNAEIKNGTDYYWSAYERLGRNLSKQGFFENLGNPVTIAFEYDYDRTPDEWKAAANSGDSLLTNYYKSLTLKNHNGNGWAADTKMVLVDANNHDKYYYLDTPPASTPTTISLFDFTDDSDNHYSPVPFQDLMTVTVGAPPEGETGHLVMTGNSGADTSITIDEKTFPATVKDATGKYYAYVESVPEGTTAYYVTNVSNVNTERYYLSIFTKVPVTNDANVYRYEISSPESFAQTGTGVNYTAENWNVNSWRANKVDKNTVINLFTGTLYDNALSLVVTPKKSQLEMSAANNQLGINMKANISLTANAKSSGVGDNMYTFRNDAYIYQTFLMMYDKLEDGGTHEIGIDADANAKVGITSYYCTGGNVSEALTENNASAVSDPHDKMIESTKYIELRNEENLIKWLGDSSKNNAATLQVNFDMIYAADDLSAQFPQKDPDIFEQSSIGTNVIGYSKIASSIDSAANSATYDKKNDGDSSPKLYYTSNESTASLKYNVEETPRNKAGRYSYLGINSVETGDDEVFVDTYAVYDTHKLKSAGDYVELTLTLSNKGDGYVTPVIGEPIPTGSNPLIISNYISDLKIYGAGEDDTESEDTKGNVIFDQTASTFPSNTIVTTKSDYLYTVRVHKSLLKTQTDGVYVIPVTFKVKTGNTTFKNGGLEYSNYKVSLTAALYSSIDDTEHSKNSYAFDHIIYTNARVLTSVVN